MKRPRSQKPTVSGGGEALEDLVAGQRRRQVDAGAGGDALEALVGLAAATRWRSRAATSPASAAPPAPRAGRRACGSSSKRCIWTRLRMVPSALVRAAWITVWPPPGRPGAARRPPGRRKAGSSREPRKSSSSASPRLIEAATNGFTTMTKPMPSTIAASTGTAISCSAETPDGAHHHELAGAGEAQEGDEARQHQHQREHLVEHLGRLQQGDRGRCRRCRRRTRRSGAGSRPR